MSPSRFNSPVRSKPQTQSVLSSYFSQSPRSSPLRRGRDSSESPRKRVDIDLTNDEDEGDSDAELWSQIDGRPPAKKRKVTVAPSALSGRVVNKSSVPAALHRSPFFHSETSQATGQESEVEETAVNQYRFSSSHPSSSQPVNSATAKKQQAAHDRARRILLSDNNILQPTLAISSEGARDASEAGSDASDGEESEDEVEETSQARAGGDGEVDFEDVMSFFAYSSTKGKGKGKGKAGSKAGKASKTTSSIGQPSARSAAKQKAKAKEVGPSGQPWTPMELQVQCRFQYEAIAVD
jgi:hypothetical protein